MGTQVTNRFWLSLAAIPATVLITTITLDNPAVLGQARVMNELRIEIQFPHGEVPNIAAPEELPPPSVVTRRLSPRRANSFDANLRSNSTVVDVVTWVVGSGAVGASVKILKDLVVAYLANRSVEIEISNGDRKVTAKGPLSKKQLDDILKEVGTTESE